MPQQIQTTFSQPVDFIPQIRNAARNNADIFNQTTSSSTRATMRRMRTETPATTLQTGSFEALDKDKSAFSESFIQALMAKNYAEIFVMLWKADIQYDRLSEHADFVQGQDKACSMATKAYSLAMMKNPKAINLCDEAAEQFKQVLSGAMEQESVCTSRRAEFFECFDSFHLFYRGFLELSLGQRVEAIRDIRSSLSSLRFQPDCPQCFDEETLFFIKILEQKLGESLIPIPQEIDIYNPKALFVADQYNQALALLDAQSDYPDTLMLKAACHAMLGRFEEAKECLEDGDFCTSSTECTHPLIDFLQGDYESIKMPSVNLDDPAILLMLPLAVKGLES